MKLLIYLSIGTTVMLFPVLLQSRWQKLKLWKSLLLTPVLTAAGTVGTMILFFIENHWIGGTSFYGAVFFVPVVFLGVAKLLREPYRKIMDLCAPAECAMLVVMKIQCLISGCCHGRTLCELSSGTALRFPSQWAELINALVIMFVLLLLAKKKPCRGDLFPMYMVIYGCSRFVLNLLRADLSVFLIGLPAGNFWSVVSVLIGGIWLYRLRKKPHSAHEIPEQSM